MMRFGSTVCVAVVVATIGCGKNEPGNAQDTAGAKAPPLATVPERPKPLALDGVPQGARDALKAQAPDFTPWSADNYDASVRAAAHTSADEGLSVLRGRFRTPSTVDYIVAGYDRRVHGERILAILAEPNAAFKVVSVSQGPNRADSVAKRATAYMLLAPSAGGMADFIVKRMGQVNEQWTWVPGRKRFLLIEGS